MLAAEFVVFHLCWSVVKYTFRPHCYHCNIINEFMALIWDVYNSVVVFPKVSMRPPRNLCIFIIKKIGIKVP